MNCGFKCNMVRKNYNVKLLFYKFFCFEHTLETLPALSKITNPDSVKAEVELSMLVEFSLECHFGNT